MSTAVIAPLTSTYAAPDLLRYRAAEHPGRTAITVAGVPALTFGEWEERSNRAARALMRQGVRPGDRVGLIFGSLDWADYAVAYFGVLKLRAAAVHLSSGMRLTELARRLRESGAAGVVHTARARIPAGFGGWRRSFSDLRHRDGSPVTVPIALTDIADILYTSGTTGPAKAFSNPHGTLTFGRGPAGLARLDVSAPMLAPMPMGTPSSAMTVGMMALTSPSTVLLCRPGDVRRMGRLIARHGAATLLLTPWVAMRMVADRPHERHDLSSVTTIALASAPLPAAVARALTAMMPNAVITTAYAQGEAVPAVVLNTYDPERPRCVGRPAPGTDLRVAGPDGTEVRPGELGEIWMRSAAPKRLYLDDALNRAVHGDGWTRTRDLGHLGDDGALYLFDRQADAIRVGPRLISSIEVEGVIYDHSGVREAAVVGVPDRRRGQRVEAVVVLSDPAGAPSLRRHLRERLDRPARPERLHLADALPRGITGKVLKHELRRRLSEP